VSLATNVTDLATAVATAVKETRNRIGDLASLSTTDKSSTVAAINEVASSAAAATGIDDANTTITTTWSSSKIDGLFTSTSTADRDRTNHTGVQPASTITGLATVATSGGYGDLTGTPTIPASYADLTGTVPQSALPSIALTEFLGAVADETAMLALTGQRGDWATRTDLGTDWQLVDEPSSLLASWREMTYPASPVSSVNGRTGAVTGLAEASDLGDLTGFDPVATFTAALS
jgi:hypothetical protein